MFICGCNRHTHNNCASFNSGRKIFALRHFYWSLRPRWNKQISQAVRNVGREKRDQKNAVTTAEKLDSYCNRLLHYVELIFRHDRIFMLLSEYLVKFFWRFLLTLFVTQAYCARVFVLFVSFQIRCFERLAGFSEIS